MCGIVGYIGYRQASPILIKGLTRLEYRGYDSAGIALVNGEGKLSVYKTKGKVKDLEALVADKDTSGTVGIAHTRWATHGEPSERNAHPHWSESKNLALINGERHIAECLHLSVTLADMTNLNHWNFTSPYMPIFTYPSLLIATFKA